MDTRAISELFPDWQERGAPITQPVTSEEVLFLSEKSAPPTPKLLLPDCLRNHGGQSVISLGAVCKWLAQQAEALGVDVYPGFVADEVLFDAQNRVRGIATGNMGLSKDGQPSSDFQLGITELLGKYTLFAEGALPLGQAAHSALPARCPVRPQLLGNWY